MAQTWTDKSFQFCFQPLCRITPKTRILCFLSLYIFTMQFFIIFFHCPPLFYVSHPTSLKIFLSLLNFRCIFLSGRNLLQRYQSSFWIVVYFKQLSGAASSKAFQKKINQNCFFQLTSVCFTESLKTQIFCSFFLLFR